MTKRRARLIAASVTLAALIAVVLGMRSIASWRPQTIAVLPDKNWWASHISDDGRFLVMSHALRRKSKGLFLQTVTLDIATGKKVQWPIYTPNVYCGYTENFFWQAWDKTMVPKDYPAQDPPDSGRPPVICRLELYDVQTGQLLKTLRWQNRSEEYFVSLQVRQKGRVLRAVSQQSVADWDLNTSKRLNFVRLQPKGSEGEDLLPQKSSPETDEIFGGRNLGFVVWDAQTGKIRRSWENEKPEASGDFSFFSPDSSIAVYNDQQAKLFRFYAPRTGKILWESHPDAMFGVTFSPDSKLVFVLKKDGCEVHNALSGRLIHRLRGPRAQDLKEGGFLLGNADWIYTQNKRGEVQRWRVR